VKSVQDIRPDNASTSSSVDAEKHSANGALGALPGLTGIQQKRPDQQIRAWVPVLAKMGPCWSRAKSNIPCTTVASAIPSASVDLSFCPWNEPVVRVLLGLGRLGLIAEDTAEVGDGGVEFGGRRCGQRGKRETGEDGCRFVASEPVEKGGEASGSRCSDAGRG
jgi:hypothetical protein